MAFDAVKAARLRPGKLYLISAEQLNSEGAGYVKIGVSEQEELRIKTLQVGCPFLLSIQAAYACPSMDRARSWEQAVKVVHKGARVRGEWYFFTLAQVYKLTAALDRCVIGDLVRAKDVTLAIDQLRRAYTEEAPRVA
jgi:hypothetical protein